METSQTQIICVVWQALLQDILQFLGLKIMMFVRISQSDQTTCNKSGQILWDHQLKVWVQTIAAPLQLVKRDTKLFDNCNVSNFELVLK